MSPNNYPVAHEHEHEPSGPKMELLQHPDGAANLLFRRKGDVIDWSETSSYSDPALPLNRIIVQTESGNQYFLGNNIIFSARKNEAYRLSDLPEALPTLTIGDRWHVPGVASTSRVTHVLLRYKSYDSVMPSAEQSTKPDPFPAVDAWLEAADNQLAP